MKKNVSLSAIVMLMVVGVFYFSCQKDEVGVDNAKSLYKGAMALRVQDCSSECILENGESLPTITSASYNTNFNASVNISNTADAVKFMFSSNASIHYIKVNDVEVYCSSAHGGAPINQSTFVYSIPLGVFGEGWNACDVKTYTITIYRNNCSGAGQGNAVTFNASHTLIGLCSGCDAESFSYATTDNKTVVFSYNSAEPLTNAEVKFTCPHISGFTATDGKTYTVNNSGNVTVLTWKGNISCKSGENTFSFVFTPDCIQNSAGFANVWTDFTVNGVSKKGTLSNIKYTCP